MLKIQENINSYLTFSHYIDGDNPSIQRKAAELKERSENEIELVKNTYYFVRDEIKHSWDVQDKRVSTCDFLSKLRAIEMRCFSPPDNPLPFSPQR